MSVFYIRIPDDLHDWIQQQALSHEVNMASEFRRILRKAKKRADRRAVHKTASADTSVPTSGRVPFPRD